jgi:hypothetical protein
MLHAVTTCDVAVVLAGYSSQTVPCESVALLPHPTWDAGDRGDRGDGVVSWRAVSVDTIKQHVVSKGWGHVFSCAVDPGPLVVADWPLHLLRPFGMCFRCS